MEHNKNINMEKREGESRDMVDEETVVDIDGMEEDIVEGWLIDKDYEPSTSTSFVTSLEIDCSSLTVEWLPDRVETSDGERSVQKIILGTYAANGKPNYLILAQVTRLLYDECTNEVEDGSHDYEDDCTELARGGKVEAVQQITHDGEVNRARYMPQNPFTIATKTISSEVHIFDYRNHPKLPLDGPCNPDLRLMGHSFEGMGLSWSTFKQGLLLSGALDTKICLWDINGTPKDKALDAMQIFKAHEGSVEDVAWHSRHEYIFGSCGDDRCLNIWDLRAPCFTKHVQSLMAHQSEINCLAFNPFNDWVVATGSSDKTVKLFDLRKFTASFHTFDWHKSEVFQIGWSPQHEGILASGYDSSSIMVWDLNRINEGQTSQAEDGPPELLFIHSGHLSSVFDLSWNPCEDWLIASVADDYMLQIW